MVRVDAAAAVRTGFWFIRKLITSAIVYLPVFRSGSATSSNAMIQATKKPTEYRKPSKPLRAMAPVTPRKAAAER